MTVNLNYSPKQTLSLQKPVHVMLLYTILVQLNVRVIFYFSDDEVEYCDFRNVHNKSHPATKHVYDAVMRHCRSFGPCYKDCSKVVRDLSKIPCYHGNVWEWSRNKIVSKKVVTNETADWLKFYAAVDSCKTEVDATCCDSGAETSSYFVISFYLSGFLMIIFKSMTMVP